MTKKNELESNRKPWGYWKPETIETQVKQYIQNGRLSIKMLYDAGRGDLVNAMGKYPHGFPGLQEKLGITKNKHPRGYWTTKRIEETVRKYTEDERFSLTMIPIEDSHRLENAIRLSYPGGFKKLKENLGLKSIRKPDGFWTTAEIEKQISVLVHKGEKITRDNLVTIGQSVLANAIAENYPGGYQMLKQKMGLKTKRKLSSWNIPGLEMEAKTFARNKPLTKEHLIKEGRSDLIWAIEQLYPGGLVSLKEKLGLTIDRRNRGYWTVERIKEEVSRLSSAGEEITSSNLKKVGKRGLAGAIDKHIGYRELKKVLGLKYLRSKDEWTPESIEKQITIYVSSGKRLSIGELNRNGQGSLAHAIISFYPGGIQKLKVFLGLEVSIKPRGFWDRDTVFQEAKGFLKEFGLLTWPELRKRGRKDLANAINKYYPGRFRQLRKDLLATNPDNIQEANIQIEALLKD